MNSLCIALCTADSQQQTLHALVKYYWYTVAMNVYCQHAPYTVHY
jgi:hypothetical protein